MGKGLEKCQGKSYRKLKMGGILCNYENVWKEISCVNMEDKKM